MTKSTKSHLRGFSPPVSATPTNALRALVNSPLFENSSRVHELVARAVRGKCVRHGVKHKSVVLPLPATSTIPRVRTYHTKKPSRFVHALSARPLKKRCGRESNMYADGIEHIFFAFSVGYAWTLSCRGRRLDDPHDTTGSKSSSATRIRCCAMLGYGEPRGRCLGAIIGKPVR